MPSDPKKTAPGKVRMACRIWEPQPIKERKQQDEVFVYNVSTLSLLKNAPESFNYVATASQEPQCNDSIYLKENYVYWDTFLKINNKPLTTEITWLLDYQGNPLYKPLDEVDTQTAAFFDDTTTAIPSHAWMYHQTFVLNGSLFSSQVYDPTGTAGFAAGLSRWVYLPHPVSEQSPGRNGKTEIDEFNPGFITNPDGTTDINSDPKVHYKVWRQTHRIMPMQTAGPVTYDPSLYVNATDINVSQASSTGIGNITKPVHWLALKETKMFAQEDFFVEFAKGAVFTNTYTGSTEPMLPDYEQLDARKEQSQSFENGAKFHRNAGVISINGDGTINQKDSVDLSKQPYYLIEINHGSFEHNYWIIIPWNSKPIFIHRGVVPVLLTPLPDNPEANQGPRIVSTLTGTEADFFAGLPTRRLSTYNISGKELIDQDYLRITVRNHMGKLVITFNGHEDNPWIIERNDYDLDAYTADPSVIKVKQIPLIVKDNPIQIGAGNILCGFIFSPLCYQETAHIDIPQTITVKGPVQNEDLQLLLNDKGYRIVPEEQQEDIGTNEDSGRRNVYTQDAELYIDYRKIEDLDSKLIAQPKYKSLSWYNSEVPNRLKGIMNDYDYPRNYEVGLDYGAGRPRDDQGYVSFIRVKPITSLMTQVFDATDTQIAAFFADQTPDPYEKYLTKHFYARYEMGAGDMVVGLGDPLREWVIPACITPIGNGWRLKVNPSTIAHDNCAVEVAQHVIQFSCTSSYTDNIRVERSGSIKFIMNFGKMTGTPWANLSPNVNQGDSGGDDPDAGNQPEEGDVIIEENNEGEENEDSDTPESNCNEFAIGENLSYQIDQSAVLANLSGKTFFIRVYAWWDGGFMECNNIKCPCNTANLASQGGNPHIVFTGLCHGGGITVENGKRYMECQLLDYWKILQDQKWLNSPFFDGMRDFNAVNEILRLAGFAATADTESQRIPDPYPPASFINRCANALESEFVITDTGGEIFFQKDFGLPSSYDIIQSPILKFADGSGYDEAIVAIAQKGPKTVYFDRYGIFKMVERSDNRLCFQQENAIKCKFYASPNADYGTGCDNYAALALTSYSYTKKVADTFTDLHVITATPNGELLIAGDMNLATRFDPTKDGYIGYSKRFTQMDGIFGTQEALQNVIKLYSAFYTPPIVVNWESFGIARINASDLVTFTGLQIDNAFPKTPVSVSDMPAHTATLYLTSVTMDIDPSRNEWKNRYEGEWIYRTCDFGAEAEEAQEENNS